MKKVFNILVLFFVSFMFYDNVNAAVWTCEYKVNYSGKDLNYTFQVDSNSGVIKDKITINYDGDSKDITKIENSRWSNTGLSAFLTLTFPSFDDLNKISNSGSGYKCPSSSDLTFHEGAMGNGFQRYLYIYAPTDSSGKRGELATETVSASSSGEEGEQYTCKNNVKGTCPEGNKCEMVNGSYTCVAISGDERYEEVCESRTQIVEGHGMFTDQCFSVTYKNLNGTYIPEVKRYSSNDCTGTLGNSYSVEQVNEGFIVEYQLDQYMSDRERTFVLPKINSCDEVPKSGEFSIIDSTNMSDAQVKENAQYVLEEMKQVGFGEAMECSELLGTAMTDIVATVLVALKIGGLIICMVKMMLSLIPAIASKDPDALSKALSTCVMLLVICAIILLLDVFINFIGNLFGFDLTCFTS